MYLLSVGADAKTVKGEKAGYLTGVLYMAPARVGGFGNVCAGATEGCEAACLAKGGRAAFDPKIPAAQLARKALFFTDREAFGAKLVREISALVRKAEREGLTPVVRLNGTSDIPWERVKVGGRTIFEIFPGVQFYDYTKVYGRFSRPLPANYHLTASYVPERHEEALALLDAGYNVAVVMRDEAKPRRRARSWTVPADYLGRRVLDGDESDLRFMDERGGFWVGLKAKAEAWRDTSGFVVDVQAA